jgi:two-component system sensor histidine kinase YesM
MKIKNLIYITSFLLCFFQNTLAQQDTIKTKKEPEKVKVSSIAQKLETSLLENDEQKIAENYERLAKEFDAKGNKKKAEKYFKKAQAIYAKRNETKRLNTVSRGLAKNQEAQKDYNSAISNYEIARKNAESVLEEKINSYDAKRLENIGNPSVQEAYADKNIKLNLDDGVSNKEDLVTGFWQKANIQATTNNTAGAITNYNNAIAYSTKPAEIVELKSEIANVYANAGQFDVAIRINEKLFKEAKVNNDYNTQIIQMQSLAKVYFKKNETQKALLSLKSAYKIATESGNISETKKSMNELLKFYKSQKNEKEQMLLYADFLNNFDAIIAKDSSLIDSKNFEVIEEKIKQLEKEKTLSDELISKKNNFNYFLLIALLFLLGFIGLITKALFSIKIKNKKIALQSLRREMNPHFIFNSLNSVNQFISENNELEANKYLTSYSNLMRTTMEYSNRDFISLNTEIEQLKKYLALEHLRFQDKFDYTIVMDENFDYETSFVPNMILQPQLENSIWHGLRYLKNKGKLELRFENFNDKIKITIDDTGIGLSKSKELKTQNQKAYESRGMNNTIERIVLLNDLYKSNIEYKITEKTGKETGTIVEIVFPMIHKA